MTTFRYEIGLAFIAYCFIVFFLFVSVAFFVKIFRIMFSDTPANPTRQLFQWARSRMTEANRLGHMLHGTVLVSCTLFLFLSIKNIIPQVIPFRYDETFMLMDRYLFFGADPWRILHIYLSDPYATSIISFLYTNIWLAVIAMSVTYALFFGDKPRSRQFLLSIILSWIVSGNILAILFSSAGPCYYHLVVDGPNPYQEQMEFLRAVDAQTGLVTALRLQDLLWSSYANNDGVIAGISAMPSLHVMFVFIISIYAYKINKIVGVVAYIYALIILIGSIHLAWHYAVDGIGAVLLGVITWLISGRIIGLRKQYDGVLTSQSFASSASQEK